MSKFYRRRDGKLWTGDHRGKLQYIERTEDDIVYFHFTTGIVESAYSDGSYPAKWRYGNMSEYWCEVDPFDVYCNSVLANRETL